MMFFDVNVAIDKAHVFKSNWDVVQNHQMLGHFSKMITCKSSGIV